MSSLYSYNPPKRNGFGHVPLTKDRAKLYQSVREFLAKHADIEYIQTRTLLFPPAYSNAPASPGQLVAERYTDEMHTRFGPSTHPTYWQLGAADLEPAINLFEHIVAWPEWNDTDLSLTIGFHFTWRNEAPSIPDDPIGSFITLFLGHHLLLQPFLQYRSLETVQRVEPEFKTFKLFRLNPANYRLNHRKLKPVS